MLRHSSRRQRLDSTVLAQRLADAVAYDRIDTLEIDVIAYADSVLVFAEGNYRIFQPLPQTAAGPASP